MQEPWLPAGVAVQMQSYGRFWWHHRSLRLLQVRTVVQIVAGSGAHRLPMGAPLVGLESVIGPGRSSPVSAMHLNPSNHQRKGGKPCDSRQEDGPQGLIPSGDCLGRRASWRG